MYNIVFPCMMMSTLTVLVFCMPPDSGEKIALGVTVILAFSVFMLAIAERMPETSESIPLIGTIKYYRCSLSIGKEEENWISLLSMFMIRVYFSKPIKSIQGL